MGIIKAAINAIGGGLADQWLEVLEADDMGSTTVFTSGVKVRNDGRNQNTKASDNTVSNGSIIHVYDNQFMIALAGSFDVVLDNGRESHRYTLNRPYLGLLIPPGYWRTMDNFSAGSVCVVITDNPYDESDYIREYEEFVATSDPETHPF